MDFVVATWFVACTTKRRQEWSEAVPRAGEEIGYVEAARHARNVQGLEDGCSDGREETL